MQQSLTPTIAYQSLLVFLSFQRRLVNRQLTYRVKQIIFYAKKELLNIVLFIIIEIIKSIIRVDRRVQYTRNYKVVGILFKTIDRYTMSRSLTF